MTGRDLAADCRLAISVADDVDALTLDAFRAREFTVAWKANDTEVTEIDRAAESRIVSALVSDRPDDAAYGEEHGLVGDPDSPWRWVVDPIDGTSGFVRGIPVWGSLIALTHRDRGAVLGVVSAPALGRRWCGGHGVAARASVDGEWREIRVSTVDSIVDAQVSITHSRGWERLGATAALVELGHSARRCRGLGDFWQHMLVAEGSLDVAIDAVGVAPHDIAAVLPIVEAAGGRLTDRLGVPTHLNDTAISSNGRLHDHVLQHLPG